MYNINAQKNLAAVELKEGLEGSRSWHHQYRHSAYIYVGGLHPGLSEGDIVIVFSQFGEIVDCHMVRDKTTGKPKGFAYICYDDQRSTNLAVDNMSGFQMLKRTIRVDHCEKFKAPKQFDENDLDENGDAKLLEYKATGAEGKGYQIYNELDSQKKLQNVVEDRQKYQDDRKSKAAPEDEDEAWARSFEDKVKVDNEIDKERKKLKKLKKDKKELKKMKKEAKRLKKEAKKAKKEKKKKKDGQEGGMDAKKLKKELMSDDDEGDSDSDSDSDGSDS